MTDIAIGIIITFLFVCMALLFCAILIKVYVAKLKKYNQILFDKQLEQQKAVSKAVLETQEETLNNIALDLHDDTGQRLTYLNLQLEQIKLQQPELTATIQPVSTTVNDLAINLRELSHSMTSNSLIKTPLFNVIEKEIARVNRLGVVVCSMKISNREDFYFSLDEKIILYRIFQEVLNNMLKHSRASEFVINISNPEQPSFSFRDNGKGFKINNESLTNGFTNMKLRCELIGYELQVNSQEQKGTHIQLVKEIV